jgi:hypothetical protein
MYTREATFELRRGGNILCLRILKANSKEIQKSLELHHKAQQRSYATSRHQLSPLPFKKKHYLANGFNKEGPISPYIGCAEVQFKLVTFIKKIAYTAFNSIMSYSAFAWEKGLMVAFLF